MIKNKMWGVSPYEWSKTDKLANVATAWHVMKQLVGNLQDIMIGDYKLLLRRYESSSNFILNRSSSSSPFFLTDDAGKLAEIKTEIKTEADWTVDDFVTLFPEAIYVDLYQDLLAKKGLERSFADVMRMFLYDFWPYVHYTTLRARSCFRCCCQGSRYCSWVGQCGHGESEEHIRQMQSKYVFMILALNDLDNECCATFDSMSSLRILPPDLLCVVTQYFCWNKQASECVQLKRGGDGLLSLTLTLPASRWIEGTIEDLIRQKTPLSPLEIDPPTRFVKYVEPLEPEGPNFVFEWNV